MSTKKTKREFISEINDLNDRMNTPRLNYSESKKSKTILDVFEQKLKDKVKEYNKWKKEGHEDYEHEEGKEETKQNEPSTPPKRKKPKQTAPIVPLVPTLPIDPVAKAKMERDLLIQQYKEKTVLEQTATTTKHLADLDKKQARVEKLKNDLFANSQIHQELNEDGVLVEKPLFIEQVNQSRTTTSIGANMRGQTRRNKNGEWTLEELRDNMIPIRTSVITKNKLIN